MEKNNKWRQTMKTQNINEKLFFNQIATRKKIKLGRLRVHENWMRTFVLRIFVGFSWHIALVYKGPLNYGLATIDEMLFAFLLHIFKSWKQNLRFNSNISGLHCQHNISLKITTLYLSFGVLFKIKYYSTYQ